MSTLIIAGKIAGTAALGAGALFAGVQANGHHAEPTHENASSRHAHCARAFPHASADLKKKVKELRQEPAGKERRTALRKLQREVAKGTYGTKSQVASYRQEVSRLRLLAKAPDALKADLKSAAKQDNSERREAVTQVWKDAAGGKYGDDVKKVAERAAKRLEACTGKQEKRQQKQEQQPSSTEKSS